MRTAKEFEEQSKKKSITEWMVYRCSICKGPCGFVFESGKVYYDSNCSCSGMSYIQPRDWGDVAKYYNTQTAENIIADMDLFWGFETDTAQAQEERKTTFTWLGRPESELSRNDLLEIINYLHKENEKLSEENRRISKNYIIDLANQAKKRLRL